MPQFSIRKNRHYCRWFWVKMFNPRWNHNKWSIEFVIHADNWIEYREGETINKLYGCGFGFSHHENSWRIGWTYNFKKKGCFFIHAYCYDETGTHIDKLIGEVHGNKKYTITVESMRDKYYFTCLDLGAVIVDIPNIHKDCKLQFDLYPYHGGKLTAPQDETFFIDYQPL